MAKELYRYFIMEIPRAPDRSDARGASTSRLWRASAGLSRQSETMHVRLRKGGQPATFPWLRFQDATAAADARRTRPRARLRRLRCRMCRPRRSDDRLGSHRCRKTWLATCRTTKEWAARQRPPRLQPFLELWRLGRWGLRRLRCPLPRRPPLPKSIAREGRTGRRYSGCYPRFPPRRPLSSGSRSLPKSASSVTPPSKVPTCGALEDRPV